MKLNQFIKKYGRGWECDDCGCVTSPMFVQFAKDFRSVLKSISPDWVVDKSTIGHYDFSAFMKNTNGEYLYVSLGSVRFDDWRRILYRTAKSNKDYTGGYNQYCELENLESIFCKE